MRGSWTLGPTSQVGEGVTALTPKLGVAQNNIVSQKVRHGNEPGDSKLPSTDSDMNYSAQSFRAELMPHRPVVQTPGLGLSKKASICGVGSDDVSLAQILPASILNGTSSTFVPPMYEPCKMPRKNVAR